MKSILFVTTLLFAHAGLAQSTDSQVEDRHLAAIEEAIFKSCGISGAAKVIENKSTLKINDQHREYDYLTRLTVSTDCEQYACNSEYTVTAASSYASAYDRSSQRWGIYSVQLPVACKHTK
jgi:hypothetical protein